jgi:hypothetical protein
VHFEAKACKVALYKGKSLDQSFTSEEGEGVIVSIKELVDLIGGR